MPAARLTVTVDEDLLAELRSQAGPGEMSAFVVEALRARLRTHPLRALLDELDDIHGPLADTELQEGHREWSQLKQRLSSTPAP